MAALRMGRGRRSGFVRPNPSEREALVLEAVQLAVELGVDPNTADVEGRTAA